MNFFLNHDYKSKNDFKEPTLNNRIGNGSFGIVHKLHSKIDNLFYGYLNELK